MSTKILVRRRDFLRYTGVVVIGAGSSLGAAGCDDSEGSAPGSPDAGPGGADGADTDHDAGSGDVYDPDSYVPEEPYRDIDHAACIGCGQCVPLCPMGAISLDGKSSIDPVECAECGVCFRSNVCPAGAIKVVTLEWPRVLRSTFSDPLAEHEATGVVGRGTEGIKTNDSQDVFEAGQMGVIIELGRPVLGARFYDVERVVKRFKARGYDVIPHNPVSGLIEDAGTGALKPDILYEKVISCLVEFSMPESAHGELMSIVGELSRAVDSVFSLQVALRADSAGQSPFDTLFGPDVISLPNGKVNLGLAENMTAGGA